METRHVDPAVESVVIVWREDDAHPLGVRRAAIDLYGGRSGDCAEDRRARARSGTDGSGCVRGARDAGRDGGRRGRRGRGSRRGRGGNSGALT